jgi:hypothetical protein
MLFLKYLELASSLILFLKKIPNIDNSLILIFFLIAKTDGSLKNQRTAQHWFGPMLVNSGF